MLEMLIDWIAANPAISSVIIFCVALCESLAVVGIVVPGIVFMLGAGALVGLGTLPLWPTLTAAALGAIAGDAISYWLGRHFDKQLRHIWPLSRYPELIPKGENFFRKYGGISVMLGRFIGPIRPIIPAIAGIMHMPALNFYFVNVLSALLWAPVVILPGMLFGESLQLATQVWTRAAVLLLIIVVLFWLLGKSARIIYVKLLSDYVSRWAARFIVWLREPLYHVALAAAAFVMVITIAVSLYEPYPPFKPSQFDMQTWWQDAWREQPKYRNNDQSADPVRVQWWSTYDALRTHLEHNKWRRSLPVNMVSAVNYLLPDLKLIDAPIPGLNFNGRNAELIYILLENDAYKGWVLYLWPWQQLDVATNQLWLGVLRRVTLRESFFDLRIPYIEQVRLGHGLDVEEVLVSSGVRARRESGITLLMISGD